MPRKKSPAKKPAAPSESPAKKPSVGLAANRKKRRVRKNPAPPRAVVANPPALADLTGVLLPGFGAYAATRALQRVVYQIVQRKWPKLGKHAHAASGVAAFAGVWFLGHKIQRLAKYHDGIVMGSGVAAMQGVAQAYLPEKYKWLLSDCKPSDVKRALPAPVTASLPATREHDEYGYLDDQLDAIGDLGGTIDAPRPSRAPVADAMTTAADADESDAELDPDLAGILGNGEGVDDLYSGSFAEAN